MKILFYRLWQCSYGIIQSFLGFCLFMLNLGEKHFGYHGAVVTRWRHGSSVSLGMFLFISKKPYFSDKFTEKESETMLLVHEYGHTVQSLLLGPLYLPIIGLPSLIWAALPRLRKMRRDKKISYYSLYTESWANSWGEKATKEKSMGRFI